MVEQDFSKQIPATNRDQSKSDSPFESLTKRVTSLGSRLRVLEERYTNLRKKNDMSDENFLNFEREIRVEMKDLNKDFLDIKRSVGEINDNLLMMSSELDKSVKQSDFKVVERYVDLWQPMNFVTRDEFN
ncbi:MAG: hypothetical protein KJ583_01655, partial [Nanoarchaeota archaeon]|nr:hypothetical protein [Nanoarchaeota archaeon]MBU1603998.1 hypothetical protein [Nanoarchaeota archaeon]